MNDAERNALRAAARRCNEELHQAVTDNPNTPFDQLSGPIIKKHYSPIAPVFSLGVFMWTIGVMNGRFVERQL